MMVLKGLHERGERGESLSALYLGYHPSFIKFFLKSKLYRTPDQITSVQNGQKLHEDSNLMGLLMGEM